MSNADLATHPLRTSIEEHQIRRVAVVDDAFDKVALATFREGEVHEFIEALNEDDELLNEFHKTVSGSASENLLHQDDLTDEVVARLWQQRDTIAQQLRKTLLSTLFRVLQRKVSQVEILCDLLEKILGIEKVERFGTAAELPTGQFDLALVDYRFGPSDEQESVDRAVRWATHLYQNGRTFVILMSAEAEARGRQDYFREKSALTRGLFEYLNKEEIEDGGKFCNRLNSFCAGLKTRHDIHGFATAAVEAAEQALVALKHSIHALGIEDYAYLEQISLREDGHPLGDYMLWLFGEYFAHNLAVNDSLQAARSDVNGIRYERFLPLQRPPSVMLAKMYSAAITEPVYEGWGPHPRIVKEEQEEATRETGESTNQAGASRRDPVPAAEDGPQPGSGSHDSATTEGPSPPQGLASIPLYQLGDLLVATKDKPAFLILNAGCDLQFSPGERECDVDQSILLVPGRFEPLYERGSETNVKRTELFELGEETLRIVWQHTRVVAHPYHNVLAEYKHQGYERKSRLKLPYALEVQQHFAAQLTRIGVPTPTPVFRERSVEIYGKDADGSSRHLGTVSSGLVVFHHRKQDQFVLTVDCVHQILSHLDAFIADVQSEVNDTRASSADTDATEGGAPTEPTHKDAVAPTEHGAKVGGAPAIDVAKQAEAQSKRRSKYLKALREAREALATSCTFQSSLHNVPQLGKSVEQVDEISKSDRRTRLQVRHEDSLTGRFPGNAPVVLIFALPDVISPQSTIAPEAAPEPTVTDNDAAEMDIRMES